MLNIDENKIILSSFQRDVGMRYKKIKKDYVARLVQIMRTIYRNLKEERENKESETHDWTNGPSKLHNSYSVVIIKCDQRTNCKLYKTYTLA